MRFLLIPTLFILLSASLGCGSRDPLEGIRKIYPRGDEYLTWKNYALVRFPIEAVDPDLRPAILFRRESGEWLELGRSNEGFFSLHEVITYIPEMDESGVAVFDLR